MVAGVLLCIAGAGLFFCCAAVARNAANACVQWQVRCQQLAHAALGSRMCFAVVTGTSLQSKNCRVPVTALLKNDFSVRNIIVGHCVSKFSFELCVCQFPAMTVW